MEANQLRCCLLSRSLEKSVPVLSVGQTQVNLMQRAATVRDSGNMRQNWVFVGSIRTNVESVLVWVGEWLEVAKRGKRSSCSLRCGWACIGAL